jgi:hypothetical protein
MNHHLTDDQVAQLPLAGARAVLLEEIMATPTLAPTGTPIAPRRVRRTLGSLGAAAAVAAVIATTFVVTHDPTGPSKSEPLYPSSEIEAAEKIPRIALDLAGWKITEVYGFKKDHGMVTYSNGTLSLELDWVPVSNYQSNYTERTTESREPVEPIDVAGHDGVLVTYERDRNYMVLLEPSGDTFIEIFTQTPIDADAWQSVEKVKDVLARFQPVSVDEWLARMPSSVVTPAKAGAAVAAGLAGVPLPPGLAVKDFVDVGVNQRDSFSSRLAGDVACSWIDAWGAARSSGNDDGMAAAVAALEGAESWPVVKDLGPASFMGSVDAVLKDLRAGRLPSTENDYFGCE